jgi:hypothetical protein
MVTDDVIDRAEAALSADDCALDSFWAGMVIELITQLKFARMDANRYRSATSILRAELGIR